MSGDLRARLETALAAHRAGRLNDAAAVYRAVLAEDPDQPDALALLASALRSAGGGAEEAVPLLERALAREEGRADLWYNLGNALHAAGRSVEAAEAYRRSLALAPEDAQTLANLGIALAACGRRAEACAAYEAALALDPGHPIARHNLANQESAAGRGRVALAHFREALRRDPGSAETRYNQALVLLSLGDWAQGLPAYEARFDAPGFPAEHRHRDIPAWDGRPMDGRLLAWGEQGLGDTIQYVRLLPLVATLGIATTLEVPRPLVRLLEGVAGAERVVAAGRDVSGHAAEVPLLSIPHRLGLTLGGVPARVPYLAARPERIARWRERLRPDGRRMVGLVFRGNAASPADKGRSIADAAALAPLAATAGIRWIGLHKPGVDPLAARGDGTGWRIENLPITVEHPGPDLDNGPDAFLDTAAVLMLLDAVVTTDTAIAHLAGALGRPTILMLQAVPDWRWLTERADSPWYPTMRLVRQTVPGDWTGVTARVAAALAAG